MDWLTLPTAKDDPNVGLAVTSEGAIFVTGTFADGADFGTGALTCGDSPAIARYDAVGKKALWARCLGTKGSAITVEGLAADGTGETKNAGGLRLFHAQPTSTGLWLGGFFDGTLKLKSTLTSTNGSDVLIKLSPP